ncbi:MAG: TlpA family protein disulfide reductase [Sulfurospirillum sp.]|nr:MAG: TlpA family protein disulfide reductase [Sulfurospirillum sp.]
MKYVILTILLAVNSWAYRTGETLDREIMQKLGISDTNTTVIDFFASWCEGCRHELPQIEALSRKGVYVIGVDVDEEVSRGRVFQKEMGLTFRVIDDPKGEIIEKFNPVGMPALYIIQNGKVREQIIGTRESIGVLLDRKLAR